MRALRFTGEHGERMTEGDVPEELREAAGKARAKLLERIVEQDDELTERYLAGEEPTVQELRETLRKATIAGKLVPVLCGSALKNKGVQTLLDAVVHYLPSPLDVPPIHGSDPATGEEITREASDDAPFAALAFKVATDPFVGQLTFVRVYSGVLRRGTYAVNTISGERERIGRIVRINANEREEVEELQAGNIGGIVGLQRTGTGDTLCDEQRPIVLERVTFPE